MRGLSARRLRRSFAAVAANVLSEVPELPEDAGGCSPEFPEIVKVSCGGYGVALTEPVLFKLPKMVFNLVPAGRSISGIAGKIRGPTGLKSPGISGC